VTAEGAPCPSSLGLQVEDHAAPAGGAGADPLLRGLRLPGTRWGLCPEREVLGEEWILSMSASASVSFIARRGVEVATRA